MTRRRISQPSTDNTKNTMGNTLVEEAGNGSSSKTVVFFHPDLGIGGAERLVVDAAVGLQRRGHRVVIFTSHCDPTHCFDEVRAAAVLEAQTHGSRMSDSKTKAERPSALKEGDLDVRVRGGHVIPSTLLGGRLAIACAIGRQLHLLWEVTTRKNGGSSIVEDELSSLQPTACFVDQLSAGLPVLAAASGLPIFFYCHFPDLLLAQRTSLLKKLYRIPFDALEQWSMGFADAVAVNSRFTRSVVTATWPRLARHTALRVVYPCIPAGDDDDDNNESDSKTAPIWQGRPFLLSVNRYERKKNIALAIRAFAGLPSTSRGRLVIAGGYDDRVVENVEHHRELQDLAKELGLRFASPDSQAALRDNDDTGIDVYFFRSVPSSVKARLLRDARLLIYTPAREHFGIVPLEAMQVGTPVLACHSGGPVETVVEGQTGWLRDPDDVAAWTAVMDLVLHGLSDHDRAVMAAAGHAQVQSQFTEEQMALRIDKILDEIVTAPSGPRRQKALTSIATVLLVPLAILVALLAMVVFLFYQPSA